MKENANIHAIKKEVKLHLDSDRYEHTLGVMYTAASLAMCYGEDIEKAMTAGVLHDCAKGIPNSKKIKLCEKYQIEVTESEKKNPELHKLIRELEKSIEQSKALQGLSISVERILRQHGLIDFKDFKKKTEEEVAAIRGVGKVSMKILKENGVVYKKKRKKK